MLLADIKRIQGLMSRLAVTKGHTADELRRLKEKSRKTQAFLSETKKVKDKTKDGDTMSPEKSFKQNTIMSGGGGSTSGQSAVGSLIVDLLLYGPQSITGKKGINLT